MERKVVSGIMLTLLLIGMLTLAFNVQPVKSEPGTWTGDADGVERSDADFNSKRQVVEDFLQMTLETSKSIVMIGEPTKISITIRNMGTENFTYTRPYPYPFAPDIILNVTRIGGVKRYYSIYYREIDLYTGLGCPPVIVTNVIEPMEERLEIYLVKLLEVGEYNITALFYSDLYYSDLTLSSSIILDVLEADDIEISLEQAISIANKSEDLQRASLIRSESLRNPVWLLGFGLRDNIIVDAVYGNVSIIPTPLWDMAILEVLEYQSPYSYMYILIGSTTDYTDAMIKQLEELGVIDIWVIYEKAVAAFVPCDYDRIMKIARLEWVRNVEGIMSIKVGEPIWEFIFEDERRDTMLKISTNDKYFQFIALDKTFSIKHDPSMTIKNHFVSINFEDSEIIIKARAIITPRWSFCIAIVIDVETGTRYLLIDFHNWR